MIARMKTLLPFLLAVVLVGPGAAAKGSAPMPDTTPPLIPAPLAWSPAPGSLRAAGLGRIVLGADTPPLRRQAELLSRWWREAGGPALPVQVAGPGAPPPGSIVLMAGDGPDTAPNVPGAVDERAALSITTEGVRVQADAPAGLFRGIEALRQLGLVAFAGDGLVPCGRADIAPRFGWRGMLLDSGRHLQDVDFILELIDELALYGFDVLHWHLTEDQGWRLEVPGHPELTDVGAWRTQPDGTRYGGSYSPDDVRRVVAHAASRFITVVPEIELPGHAKAALAAYPQLSCTGGPFAVETQWGVHEDVYCAGNDAVFALLGDVFDHVVSLFPSEYVHIGGDEVPKDRWLACPRCAARMQAEGLADVHALQSWFVRRAERMLAARGRRVVGWDEILEGGLSPTATVQSWRGTSGAVAAAEAGNDAVVSPTSHAYIDYDPGQLPLEQVLTFDPVPPGLPADARRHILGGEMNLWTEYAPQPRVHAQVFPRITAMAEALGAPAGDKPLVPFLVRVRAHARFWPRLGITTGAASRPLQLAVAAEPGGTLRVDAELTKAAEPLLGGLAARIRMGAAARPEGWRPDGFIEEQRPTAMLTEGRTWNGAAEAPCVVLAQLDLQDADGSWHPYGAPAAVELTPSLARGRAVTFADPPSRRYPGRGAQPLTDGARGSRWFGDGRWMGFESVDLDAAIDLGAPTAVREVSVRCIQDANSWVFLPLQVAVYGSDDGRTWRDLGAAADDLPHQEQQKTIRTFAVAADVTVRHVRVVARNRGLCPPWHPGAGEPCWLFVDEIRVR